MKIEQFIIKPSPPFPNNPSVPLTIYLNAFDIPPVSPDRIEMIFRGNGWINSWRNGVYSFHHFHSTAHEALGCYNGWARIKFGGPEGITIDLNCGDAVLIPAGVSHRLIESKAGFHVVGAYPRGMIPDMCKGDAKEYEFLFQKVFSHSPPPSPPVTDQDLY